RLHVVVRSKLLGLVHAAIVARRERSAMRGRSRRVAPIPDFARNQACADCVNLSALLHPGYALRAWTDERTEPAAPPAQPAMVSFTTVTSCLSVNGLARKLNSLRSDRLLSNASSA